MWRSRARWRASACDASRNRWRDEPDALGPEDGEDAVAPGVLAAAGDTPDAPDALPPPLDPARLDPESPPPPPVVEVLGALTCGTDGVLTCGTDGVLTCGTDGVLTCGTDGVLTCGTDGVLTCGTCGTGTDACGVCGSWLGVCS